MDYNTDERRILAVLGEYVRRKEYVLASDGTSDYLITVPVATLLPYSDGKQEKLTTALDAIRKKALDTLTMTSKTINGRIMKARVDHVLGLAEVIVSEAFVIEMTYKEVV